MALLIILLYVLTLCVQGCDEALCICLIIVYVIHRSEDESDDYELSDHEVNKLLIVTQTSQPSRYPKHEGYDRTGDWTSRVKMTQDLEQAINIGLQYYEETLWDQQEWVICLINERYYVTIALDKKLFF